MKGQTSAVKLEIAKRESMVGLKDYVKSLGRKKASHVKASSREQEEMSRNKQNDQSVNTESSQESVEFDEVNHNP